MTQTKEANRSDSDDSPESAIASGESDASEKTSSEKRGSSGTVGTELMEMITLFFAATVLVVFLISLAGRFFFFGELFGNFRLQIAGLMIPFAIIVFRMGQAKWLAYGLMIAVAWSLITLGSVYLPATQPTAGKEKLKVMSFNVLGNNSMRDEVLGLMRETDPDVIVVLEYTHHWHRRLRSLNKEYPYQALQPRWHGFGLAVFSKYPLSDTKVVRLTRKLSDIPSLVTHVDFGGQKIRLCGLHVLSPTNSFRLGLRNQQYDEIAEELLDEDVPTVVMGDFNSVPWSPFIKDFMAKTGYRDSRQGFGYHATWHSDFIFLRIPIDHAFVSDDICVHSRCVGGIAGSDHMPIIFEISTAR